MDLEPGSEMPRPIGESRCGQRPTSHNVSKERESQLYPHNMNQSIQQHKQFLTVVLWEVPLKISSAPTLGSFPLFFN